jgi:hypothetical protein
MKTRLDLALQFTGTGVELGVAGGAYSRQILECGNVQKLWSIDRWSDHHNLQEYRAAADLLSAVGGERSTVLRMTFAEAVALFADESLDFIYIDGYAHTGQESGQTLSQWWPKLKPGGIFAGHDYCRKYPATIQAVDTFAKRHALPIAVTTEESHPSWRISKPQSLPPLTLRTDNPIPAGASVCLVGNGPSVLRAAYGAQIDAHDVVIRFNWFAITGFENHTGTKTTLWSTFGRGSLPKDPDQRPAKAIFVHGDQPKAFAYAVEEAWGIPRAFFNAVRERVQAASQIPEEERRKPLLPSSGLVVALWLLEHHHVNQVSVIGFDHFSKKESGQHHYWIPRSFKTPPEHDGEAEARLLSDYAQTGRLVRLNLDSPAKES